MVGEGLGLTAVGLAVGLLVALGFTRVLSALLFGIAPLDVVTFVAAPVLVAVVAVAACLLPARRAAAVDPTTALRVE